MMVEVDGRKRFYSASCGHCENPACIAACSKQAFYKATDGTVLHDDEKCIGCGKCVSACPYGAISINQEKNVATKCDGCYDRRQKGLEPACVAACINRSLLWGGTGNVQAGDLKSTIPGILPSPEMTNPRFRIKNGEGK